MTVDQSTTEDINKATKQDATTQASPYPDARFDSLIGASSDDGRVMVGQDIEIYPDRPCNAFASYETRAFEAKDRRQPGDQFALLCGRHTVPRVTSIASYKNLKSPNIMRLIEAGVVNWKHENRQRFVFVFDKPNGQKLLDSPEAVPYRFSEDRIIPALIQPIVTVLAEFRNADIVHGGINPENIFVTGSAGAESAVLGECLTSAPSFRQHALFETIERGMAQPTGRGQGTLKEDLYAFGMCVAMAVRGENFMIGKDPKQIVYDKIENGSYGIIVGKERMPAGVSEFLRAVLNDDETQRWDIDDALRWLEGRRLSPKQPRVNVQAARPFVFKENKFWDMRSVAAAFADDPAAAAVSIEKDQFDFWLKRNFEDQLLITRLEKVWEREKGGSRERLISSVTMALDPRAPVRYKNISAFPIGFGGALAEAMAKGDDIQNHAEMLQLQLFNNWVNLRPDEVGEAAGIITTFEKCRNYLTQKMPGYGMERVLYTLSKEAACMSPLLKNYFVLGAASLLMALESISEQPNRPDNVLDRHMIAFISVREPKMIDPHLGHVISHDRAYQLIGILRTLAAIQKRFSIAAVPGVGNWLIEMIGPALNRFNDRELRQEVAKRLNKLVDSGNLPAILDLVDDMKLVQDDANRFAQARQEFILLTNEKEGIDAHLKKNKNFGYATGRQVAMLVSSAIAVMVILGYIVAHLAAGA